MKKTQNQTATRRKGRPRGPRTSLRGAIDTFCKQCIYDPDCEGSWKKQVRDCTGTACPLYKVRTGRRTKE